MEENNSNNNALRPGTTLKNGEFVIHGVLGQGGFGITYKAEKVKLKKHVVLKELFINDKCDRNEDGKTVYVLSNNRSLFEYHKNRFLREAQRIASLSNQHIVQVHDVFEENETVYYEMDFIEGESLADMLKRTGKPLEENEVRKILNQMLDALNYIHGLEPPLCHLDIKPGNIMMKNDGNVVLIDFGSSKYVSNDKKETSSTSVAYTPGFAPIEQMEANLEKMGPWTDFYSLGATVYCLLKCNKPVAPSVIDEDHTPDKKVSIPLPSSVSEQMRQLVVWMMAVKRDKRPQSVEQIRQFLNNGTRGYGAEEGTNYKRGFGQANQQNSPGSSGSSSHKHQENNELPGRRSEEEGKTAFYKNGPNNPKAPQKDKPKKTPTWLYFLVFALTFACVFFLGKMLLKPNSENEENTDSVSTPAVIDTDTVAKPVLPDEPVPENGEKFAINVGGGVSVDMIFVEGGTFAMGATTDQGDSIKDNVKPRHNVTLDHYYIGETEVTQELWEAVMGYNHSENEGPTNPVENVSWDECQEFISKLNEKTKYNFRLPTEAEWEYAARGGKNGKPTMFAGGDYLEDTGWYEETSYCTNPMRGRSYNELRLYDMSGNVWEFCQDYYDPGYYKKSPSKNPCNTTKGQGKKGNRVARGGAWNVDETRCQVSYRISYVPTACGDNLGLRLAHSFPLKKK